MKLNTTLEEREAARALLLLLGVSRDTLDVLYRGMQAHQQKIMRWRLGQNRRDTQVWNAFYAAGFSREYIIETVAYALRERGEAEVAKVGT